MMSDTWKLDGKVAIVTGANSGIGLETAKMLLNAGCYVIMACRDVEKGRMCKPNDERCLVLKLDLASLKSIKEFADEIINKFKHIHILVNNAGVFHSQRVLTEDGFEIHFGVNHLGHFFLTRLLLAKLISSSPSRIINVSSKAHEFSSLDFNDLQTSHHWSSMKAYSRSKTANILFASYLANVLKDTGVTSYCIHPGVVKTNLGRHLEGSCFMRLFHCMMFISNKKMIDPTSGSTTTFHCCSKKELIVQTGLYYSDCKISRPKTYATDPNNAEMLWKMSSEMCGIHQFNTT